MTQRFAIYAMPAPTDPLWSWGSSVIGYDAASRRDVAVPDALLAAFPGWPALTEEPRRYGFHGTLKAPFRLIDGTSADDLRQAAQAFARSRPPFVVPSLAVSRLGRFCALTPIEPDAALDRLAADCVTAFDGLRAPLTDAEMARRLKSLLTADERRHLERWGYPYVFERFRFHMTLTGPLDAETADAAAALLADLYRPLDRPFAVEGIAIFQQPSPTSRFIVDTFLPFGG